MKLNLWKVSKLIKNLAKSTRDLEVVCSEARHFYILQNVGETWNMLFSTRNIRISVFCVNFGTNYDLIVTGKDLYFHSVMADYTGILFILRGLYSPLK